MGMSSKFKLIYMKRMKQKVTHCNLCDRYMPVIITFLGT